MMMRPDTGKIERVRVSGGEPAVVTIDGTAIRTQKYQVTGDTHYTVWLDQQGVPVMFVVDDQSGTVTFTLANCVSCGLNMASSGRNRSVGRPAETSGSRPSARAPCRPSAGSALAGDATACAMLRPDGWTGRPPSVKFVAGGTQGGGNGGGGRG